MNIVVPALTATLMALVAPEVGPIEGRERYPFAMSVSSGPVGTLIEMKSTSPCPPPPPGERPYVLVNFLPPTDHGTLLTTMEWFPVAGDGSWTASVTAEDSAGAASGPARVEARCAGGPDLQRYFTMTTRARGYWLLSEQPAYRSCGACPEPFPDHVADFGDAFWYGSPDGGPRLVGIAANERSGTGYWLATADGTVTAHGDAEPLGSWTNRPSSAAVVAIVADHSARGYWLVADDGTVAAFGSVEAFASGPPLPAPVVGATLSSNGRGLLLTTADGTVVSRGEATVHAGAPPTSPVVGIAAPDFGDGYWLVTEDGAVLPRGDARWAGDLTERPADAAVGAISGSGGGYRLLTASGDVFSFGSHDAGSCGCRAWDPARPLHFIALAPTPNTYSQHDPSWPGPTASPDPGDGG